MYVCMHVTVYVFHAWCLMHVRMRVLPWMYVFPYVYVALHKCICMSLYVYVGNRYVDVCMYVCVYVCPSVCSACLPVCMYVCVCMCVCEYPCMSVCMYVCVSQPLCMHDYLCVCNQHVCMDGWVAGCTAVCVCM